MTWPHHDWNRGPTVSPYARTRSADPQTSHDAAATVKVTENQAAVMMVFRVTDGAMLDEQLVAQYMRLSSSLRLPKQTPSGIRSRRAELARMTKLVQDEKRRMTTGRTGRTWRLP